MNKQSKVIISNVIVIILIVSILFFVSVSVNVRSEEEKPGFGETINVSRAEHLDVNRSFISDIYEQVKS